MIGMRPILAFLASVLLLASAASVAEPRTATLILANIEGGTYATASWDSLGGSVQTGGGIFAEVPLSATNLPPSARM